MGRLWRDLRANGHFGPYRYGMRRRAPSPTGARRAVLAGALIGTVGLAGCTAGAPASTGAASSGSPPRPSSTVRPTVRPPSGLTGYPAGIGRPQLAVKIDNTRPAFPQVGVADADIVYLEEVEGQLTRLLAIFSSRLPDVIGPVRSARETDLDLLAQFGRVDFAFSGANRGVQQLVAAAPVQEVSFDAVPAAYHRDYGRPSPYNLFLRPDRALAAKPAAVAGDIGLRFAAAAPTAGRSSGGFSVRFGPYASVAVRYDTRRHAWQIAVDGRSGGASAANVIVQYVQVTKSRFHDVLGNVTPYTVSVGGGAATVFRDGRAVPARWSRPKVSDGTRFLGPGGADVALRPGQTWILLVPRGTPIGP